MYKYSICTFLYCNTYMLYLLIGKLQYNIHRFLIHIFSYAPVSIYITKSVNISNIKNCRQYNILLTVFVPYAYVTSVISIYKTIIRIMYDYKNYRITMSCDIRNILSSFKNAYLHNVLCITPYEHYI